MGKLSVVVQQLRSVRERAQKEVQLIDVALSALRSISSNGSHHTMSVSARRKISLAQEARWAKQSGSGSTSETPKRAISVAGRRRIAAAQRARWAKVKSQKRAA